VVDPFPCDDDVIVACRCADCQGRLWADQESLLAHVAALLDDGVEAELVVVPVDQS
jgi:hypothetical protein